MMLGNAPRARRASALPLTCLENGEPAQKAAEHTTNGGQVLQQQHRNARRERPHTAAKCCSIVIGMLGETGECGRMNIKMRMQLLPGNEGQERHDSNDEGGVADEAATRSDDLASCAPYVVHLCE